MSADCCSSCEYQRTVGYPSTSWASCLHSRWRLWSTSHINRHVFSIILLTFLQFLHSKIPSPGKLVKTRHIWRHDLQTESTGSLRSLIGDVIVLTSPSTLWTCRQLDVELSWVASASLQTLCRRNSTQLDVESGCVAINAPLDVRGEL